MAAEQQTPFTAQEPSTTSNQVRTVEDTIRRLMPESAKILALVADGKVSIGETVEKKGMISKKATSSPRFEAFTSTPPDITKVATGVDSLVITFASVTDVYKKQVWENTANGSVGIVDSISNNDVTFVSIGAGTAFSVTIGDTLMRIGNAYEEGSSDPAYLQKSDDNIYNLTQIFRFPVEISATAKATKNLAGGDYFARMKKYSAIEGLRDIDRAFLFGKRASSGNKTSITGASVSTTNGLWNFAQAEFDLGGSFTPSKLYKDLPLAFDPSVGNDKAVLMMTSREVIARILDAQQSSIRITESGEMKKFGIKAHTLVTSGPDITLMAHDAFDGRGGHDNQALCFIPENVQYRYLDGRDLKPVLGLQGNSTDGFKDEIMGEIGILPLDGGYSITKVVNFF